MTEPTLTETLESDVPPGSDVSNRWAVQIEGEPDDINDLRQGLNGADGAEGLRVGTWSGIVPVLTTPKWNEVEKAQEVEALAQSALNDCVGCLNLLNVCGQMNVGTIYEVVGGKSTMTRFTRLDLKVKRAVAERAPPPIFQTLLALAREHQWFADCLPVYYEKPTFYSVYKAVEAIRRHCGGEQAVKAREDLDGSKLANIKTVADFHRHVQPPKRERPKPFYSLDECVHEVSRSIEALVDAQLRGT